VAEDDRVGTARFLECVAQDGEVAEAAPRLEARERRRVGLAVYVTTGEHGAADLLDTSKRRVLRLLRRREQAWLSEVFGTVVIGRPEPYARPCCGHMAALLAE
jgi:hypothetical protein